MKIASFRFPTSIKFGNGSISIIGEALKEAGCKRPLLVTDKGLAVLSPFERLKSLCTTAGLTVKTYSEASGNPIEDHVTKGVQAFRQHDADSIVIMGGGCALDVGKAIALMASHPGDLFDYEDDKPDARPMNQKLPHVIAIPTTAGTGSEVGGSSVISNKKTNAKVIVWGNVLIPKLVIADPELTVGLPAKVTAATGIDALTHNMEAYLAKNFHPICDGIAIEGIRLIHANLADAVKEPSNLRARGHMLMASMMGAIAFQKGLGVNHSCAHALSNSFDTHHGLANALMMGACMAFNAEVVKERFDVMGRTIGLTGSTSKVVGGFLAWVKELPEQLGLPKNLKEEGVRITPALIDSAVKDPCHANNPRECHREDFEKLFAQAYQ